MTKIQSSAVLLAFLTASAAFAQNASVSGTVSDPSGAAVVGASVVSLNKGTGASVVSLTNESGVYVFPALQPGVYTFSAEQAGFRKAVVSEVTLNIGSQLSVNMALELGQATETVEVSAAATPINATSATVGDLVTGKQLIDLPLTGRSAYNLINTQPGVVFNSGAPNFYLNGNQGNSINYTTDGITTQNNLLTGSFFNYSNVASVDRVEEVKVVTSPADAEYGRGSGQIMLVTRGGGNTFRGAIFHELRTTALNANDFFNNTNGVDRAVLVLNNYGVRFGGPLKKNKTFFNGIYEPSKSRARNTFSGLTFTDTARRGIFRFNPGVLNGNAAAAQPSIDFNGNPLNPGTLQSVSVFGLDPNRLTADPTGSIAKTLALLPSPNNFRLGDGLNTAGYTWNRPVPVDFELYEGRIDHIFNEKHRLTLTLNHQAYNSINVNAPPPFPNVPWQANPTETTQYSVTFNSVLRPNLINEFKFGVFRPRTLVNTTWHPTQVGPISNKDLLNTKNGVGYITNFVSAVTNPLSSNESNYINPNYQWGDNATWIKGRHSFKGGVEVRLISSSGYDSAGVVPIVNLGANGAVPVTGINTIPGIGANLVPAQNLLLDLSGSVGIATQTSHSPGGPNPRFLPGETRYREWHQNEMSMFFKDDFKLRPNITLNLGVRYELYLVPYEGQSKLLQAAGGAGAAFGISGTNADALFRPGVLNGSLTTIRTVGAGTANPGIKAYNQDRNNFGPALGIAWSLQGSDRFRWLIGSKDQTSIRAGYGIGFQRLPIQYMQNNSGFLPGLSEVGQLVTATNLSNLTLPVPTVGQPFAPIPTNGPGSKASNVFAFDPNLRTPYIQNFNVSVSRQIANNTTISVSYVGSKGTKLVRSMDQNEVNVFENGLLDAFKVVAAGGTSPLIDRIFSNLPVAANQAAVNAAGGGSAYVRSAAAPTQTFFANNNPGGFANFVNTNVFGTGRNGGLVPNAGLPANFITVNPQFAQSYLVGNWGSSSYHSFQISGTRRVGQGLFLQGSYVWSKALGEDDGQSNTGVGTYRTLRNRSLDKALLSFDRRHVVKINSIYELPFGQGKTFGKNVNNFVNRIIGGWQIGAIYNVGTGAPITIIGANTFNNTTISAGFTAQLIGEFPKAQLSKLPGYVTYFPQLTQIADPNRPTAAALVGRSTLLAQADSTGKPVLINALPGALGNLPLAQYTAPGIHQIDLNVKKEIKISERFNLVLGAAATNATNTPIFDAPTAANRNINSVNFGRSTTTLNTPRILVIQTRLNF